MVNYQLYINNVVILNLILLSGSILHVGFFTPLYIISLFIVILVLILKKKYKKKNILKLTITILSFVAFFLINFYLTESTQFKDYVIIIMQVFLTSITIIYLKEFKIDLKYHLYRILYYIITLSLIGFILSQFDLKNNDRLYLGESGYSLNTILYIFYYSSNEIFGKINIYRNQGIFWEPGILAIYANIFLYLSLFIYKDKTKTILATICILSTLSTTGIFILILQMFAYLRTKKIGINKKNILYLMILPIILFGINSFVNKIKESDEKAYSSYALRSFDLYSGTMIAISNPLFGIGLNEESFFKERNKFLTTEMQHIMPQIEKRGSSNSILNLFAKFGILIGVLTIYILFKQNIFTEKKTLFFLIIILSLFSEPLLFTPFFMLFIILGYQNQLQIIK